MSLLTEKEVDFLLVVTAITERGYPAIAGRDNPRCVSLMEKGFLGRSPESDDVVVLTDKGREALARYCVHGR